jgi:hypothetical protein
LLREAIVQIDLYPQFLRHVRQLGDQLGIRQACSVVSVVSAAKVQHLAELLARRKLAVQLWYSARSSVHLRMWKRSIELKPEEDGDGGA